MTLSTIITFLCCFSAAAIFFLIMFWVYGLSPILHLIIKSSGQRARAIVLEVKEAGWGWYSGGRYSETLVFQPVKVKLEIHPNTGAPYVAIDRFNAMRDVYRNKLKPGVELQVAVAGFDDTWVACLTETIVEPPVHRMSAIPHNQPAQDDDDDDPKARLQKLKGLLSSGLITQQEYDEKKKEILEDV